jgi:lipoyl(octanoyl) transferase
VVDARNDLDLGLKTDPQSPVAEWRLSEGLVSYEAAVASMEARVAAILAGQAPELIWLLEHPPLYTSGTSARPGELIEPRFPVHATGRGGQFTYHGPGQRVAYLMLDLNRRAPDVRRYVATLEEWIIRALACFGVQAERREDRIGVWVPRPDKGDGFEDKIAAIGIRLKRWVSLHGIALNVSRRLRRNRRRPLPPLRRGGCAPSLAGRGHARCLPSRRGSRYPARGRGSGHA